MTDLKNAVLWACRLDIPWTAQDVADMADSELPPAKAYLARMLARCVVVALPGDRFAKGSPDAIRAFRCQGSNAKPGGGGRAYRRGKAARDRLLTAEALARRQGNLLTRTTTNSGEPMRTNTNLCEMSENDSGLTKSEFAQAMRCTVRCVEKWIQRGRVHYCRTPGGRIRIPSRELHRILRDSFHDAQHGEIPGMRERLETAICKIDAVVCLPSNPAGDRPSVARSESTGLVGPDLGSK